jgi:hypothetical protein
MSNNCSKFSACACALFANYDISHSRTFNVFQRILNNFKLRILTKICNILRKFLIFLPKYGIIAKSSWFYPKFQRERRFPANLCRNCIVYWYVIYIIASYMGVWNSDTLIFYCELSTSFPGLQYEDEARHEEALVWAVHVTTKNGSIWELLVKEWREIL